jgi:hypothetical protein
VSLSPSIAAMLKQRKDNSHANPDDLVFTTPTGLSIDDQNFRRRAWTQMLKSAGFKVVVHTRVALQRKSRCNGWN